MLVKIFLCIFFFNCVTSEFTFRNVMVTCDSENPLDEEIPFGTIITANRLKPHLPSDQKCFKISIQHSTIPILYGESLSEINNADFLLLENDNIEEIEPGAFRNMKLKGALSLKSNKLREIRRGVFNNVQVPVLFLNYNFISYIDYKAFDNMTILESIHLDHNKLQRIDIFWFRNTPKLNKLSLQNNLIQEVPANAFQNLVSKEFSAPKIDLSHNLIESIDGDAFSSAKRLHFLSLAYNKLQTLHKNWLKGVKVNVLNLSNNRFRCLRYGLGEPHSVNYIDNNPWECSCLREMKKKEMTVFGSLVADEAFRRCNI